MSSRFLVLVGIISLCLGVENAKAQDLIQTPLPDCKEEGLSSKIFENRPWYEPLPATPHEAQTVIMSNWSKPFEYMVKPGTHYIWEVSLGREIPIVVWDSGNGGDIPIGKGCWGFGLWAPIGFHLILDFGDPSDPMINTDYQFGFMGKAAYGVSNRDRLGFKFQVGHQSSHLAGDFTVNALGIFGEKFRRVDVNYEFYEVGISWEKLYSWGGTVTKRLSSTFTAGHGHQGFYSHGVRNGVLLLPSERNYEPAVGLQYMPSASHGWRPYVAYDAHLLTTYDYDRQSEQWEKARVSQSLVLGLRNFDHQSRGVPDFVVKFYRGRNPNGQFRNQNTYWTAGFGVYIRP